MIDRKTVGMTITERSDNLRRRSDNRSNRTKLEKELAGARAVPVVTVDLVGNSNLWVIIYPAIKAVKAGGAVAVMGKSIVGAVGYTLQAQKTVKTGRSTVGSYVFFHMICIGYLNFGTYTRNIPIG